MPFGIVIEDVLEHVVVTDSMYAPEQRSIVDRSVHHPLYMDWRWAHHAITSPSCNTATNPPNYSLNLIRSLCQVLLICNHLTNLMDIWLKYCALHLFFSLNSGLLSAKKPPYRSNGVHFTWGEAPLYAVTGFLSFITGLYADWVYFL